MTFYIVGAGGLGRETLDALRAAAPPYAAGTVFLDEQVRRCAVACEVPVRRPADAGTGTFVVAIADPEVRQRLARMLVSRGLVPGQVIHPQAVVSPGAALGPGCVVLANAFVSTGAVLGAHVHVNYNATVGHDSVLGDFVTVLPGANIAGAVLGAHVHVNYNATVGHDTVLGDFVTVLPGANLAGTVTLGAGVTIGSNACVLPGLRIGSGGTVGAGAVVTRDQPDGVVVVGVPAHPLR